jgi:hypothetical protein
MNGFPIPSNDPEKKNLNLEISLRTLLSISQLTRYMVEVYGDFAGGNVDIISKDYKGKGLKINIGSKVNTNAITEANFKLQKDLMAWVLQNQFQIIPLHNSTIAHSNERVHPSLPLMEYLEESFDGIRRKD